MSINSSFEQICLLQKKLDPADLIDIGIEAILLEAKSYPSFGLVSQYDSGCHKDMNYQTFVDSTKTFRIYFEEIFNLVKNNEILNFHQLRKLGQKQEARMYKVTNNINTHKGLIFHFGIIIYIMMHQNYYQIVIKNYPLLIKNFVSSLRFDFTNFNNKTKGEKLYSLGILGARGVALQGYQIVFDEGLKFLKIYQKKYPELNQDQFVLLLLIFYLSKIEDTTLISKVGYQEAKKINEQASELLQILTIKGYNEFYQKMLKINNKMKEKKVSPGGCADLVVITLFLNQIFVNT